MNVPPLPKKFYDRAIVMEASEIHLQFSGGSDEGMLDVCIIALLEDHDKYKLREKDLFTLQDEIESWAWEVFDYSGAGDGTEFGDDIIYNLKEKTVETSGWHMARCDSETEFEVDESQPAIAEE